MRSPLNEEELAIIFNSSLSCREASSGSLSKLKTWRTEMLGILYSLPFILNSGCPYFLTRGRRHQVHALFKLRPQWFFFCLCACMYGEFRDWSRELKAGKKGTRMTIPEQKAHSAGSSGRLHLPEFTTTHDLLSMRLQRKQKLSPTLEERQRQLRSECAARVWTLVCCCCCCCTHECAAADIPPAAAAPAWHEENSTLWEQFCKKSSHKKT